jgi:hypothetical protein
MRNDEIIDKIGLKIGKITEIDSNNRTRVLLEDLETKEETPWCNFLFPYAGNAKGMFIDHAVGDKVLYTLFSDTQGFIFGQYYTKDDTVPGSENNDVLHQIDANNFLGVDKTAKALKANYESVLLGQWPTEKAVLGDILQGILEDLIDQILLITQAVSGANTVGPLANKALFDAIKLRIPNILATQVKVK